MDALRNLEFQEAEEFMRRVDLPLDEDEEIIAERFRISDVEQANWALRKIAAYKQKQREVDGLAEAEMFRIRQWQERETQSIEHSIAYFEGLLTVFLMEKRKADPKYKISTPYGKVTAKKQQPEFIRNEEDLLRWAEANNRADVIKVKKSVDWASLKKDTEIRDEQVVDKKSSKVVDGITVIERPEKIVVEVE
ncbi:MAG TPA: host-nuclease inhibitor Gam family protein [Negativicutes bacterium]|nr:host-nuclease inhibitor Gam family protein [Negativicutes bacterium]